MLEVPISKNELKFIFAQNYERINLKLMESSNNCCIIEISDHYSALFKSLCLPIPLNISIPKSNLLLE
mgnify:FL=1